MFYMYAFSTSWEKKNNLELISLYVIVLFTAVIATGNVALFCLILHAATWVPYGIFAMELMKEGKPCSTMQTVLRKEHQTII